MNNLNEFLSQEWFDELDNFLLERIDDEDDAIDRVWAATTPVPAVAVKNIRNVVCISSGRSPETSSLNWKAFQKY